MRALRGLMILIRTLGVLALALLLYAWIDPVRVSGWLDAMGGEDAARSEQLEPAAADIPDLDAIPTVARPLHVSRAQGAMARWLGARYRVSPAALEALIVEADRLGKAYKLSPNLIIAVMAIESNFHPYIQSEAGAQGLMQVMPGIHAKRYEKFGGKTSFVDPIVSLKVGAEILRDCVKLKGGSETEALRFYFGGGPASDAYVDKVRAEQRRLNMVAAGVRVPTTD
jgi:soluble lytic murein transglycosylase-like protein